MMLRYPGYLLLLLSFVSALALLAAPFGLAPSGTTGVTWLLFTLLLCVGFLLAALGARPGTIGKLFTVTGAMLMLLGCTAALCLAAVSLGVLKPAGSMAQVWAVLVAGFVLGTLGLTAKGQRR
jgi:hypothetical protein